MILDSMNLKGKTALVTGAIVDSPTEEGRRPLKIPPDNCDLAQTRQRNSTTGIDVEGRLPVPHRIERIRCREGESPQVIVGDSTRR